MVCDFKIIKQIMSDFLETLDHAMCINTDDPRYADFKSFYGDRVIGFEAIDPTTEVIAKTIFDHFKEKLAEYANMPGPAISASQYFAHRESPTVGDQHFMGRILGTDRMSTRTYDHRQPNAHDRSSDGL